MIFKATRLARAMVTQYGMSEKFGLMGLETKENEYLTGRTIMNCGDATAAEVDQEVMRILKDSYEEAKRLLSDNRDVMDKIAEFLIQKETITGKEFMKIFREMKGIPEPEEEGAEEKTRAEKKETGESAAETAEVETEQTDAAEPAAEKPEELQEAAERAEEPQETEEKPEEPQEIVEKPEEPPVVTAREVK